MLRLTKEKKRFLHIRKEKLKKKSRCDDTVVSSAILPAVDSLEAIPSSSNHSGSTIISHHGDVLEPEFRIDEVSLLREVRLLLLWSFFYLDLNEIILTAQRMHIIFVCISLYIYCKKWKNLDKNSGALYVMEIENLA